jgi:hypothetical protein
MMTDLAVRDRREAASRVTFATFLDFHDSAAGRSWDPAFRGLLHFGGPGGFYSALS